MGPDPLLALDVPGDCQRATSIAEETLAAANRIEGYTFVEKTEELLASIR